jgi:hypothetical protein
MCKEAQAACDAGKKLSPLDFRFHFFPWWKHSYSLNTHLNDSPVEPYYMNYFHTLESSKGIKLSPSQKAWYVKRASTKGEYETRISKHIRRSFRDFK